jgi:hypothetical protein
MQTAQNTDAERWHLIVLRSNTRELLLIESDRGLTLPSVKTPKGSRIARELSERVRSEWNVRTFCLRQLSSDEPRIPYGGCRCFLLETIDTKAIAKSAQWLELSETAMHRLADTETRTAIETWLRQAMEVQSNGVRQRIGDPGTFSRIRAWVEQQLANSATKLGTEFRQLNASRDFSLVRFATDHEAVWFKAVGDPNIREFSLVATLADLFPQFMAPVLAAEPLWNAWLSPEIPGCRLSQRKDLAAWRRAARDLACLQQASRGKTEALLAGNARDLRCSALWDSVRPFFARLAEFMTRQKTSQPAPLSRTELAELEDELRSSLLELQAEGCPDTLGHLDLNPDNLVVLPQRTVFLDWAETSVGHPFFSLAYLLEHFRSLFPTGEHTQLVRAYSEVWQKETHFANVARTIRRAMFVAIFAHAVSTDAWRENSDASAPAVEAYYRSLGRRMKAYAQKLREGAAAVVDL